MRIRAGLLVSTIAVVAVLATGCGGDPPTRPIELLAPLEPDTGNLGFLPVAGFPAMTLVDDSVVKDSASKAWLARRRADPTSASVRVARIGSGIDSVLALGHSLAFDVSPTRRLVFLLDRVSSGSPGYTNLRGTLQGGQYGELSLSRSPAGDLRASIVVSAPRYFSHSIEALGNGLYMIVYVDYRKFLPD